ncbi:hypothetical protein D878_gp13 [Sulfolobales Mexican rudivirus 1]|uniref:Uncharacterized protein n=1 Tax=Sulfolobales Mexican rod-shaped virus 1 TaxID=2848122 RepID=K4NZG5_9VIRU|nr:hypothetical protein D878_gp13 [Sulfolobales Mexican rudivirus 1]AFV51240.1 hypothetical protein [Sulfolobales Mexican rod-shaped virus 1]
MVTLQQVSSVTVTSPWSDYNEMPNQIQYGSIVNPFYPVFIFSYVNTSNCGLWVVGYVSGDNAGVFFNHACGWVNVSGMFYFDAFGYPYAMGGGYMSGVSSCANNGAVWWTFVNQKTGSVNAYCTGLIPNNDVSMDFISAVADLNQQNILLLSLDISVMAFLIWIIPVSEISTLLNNSSPPSIKFAVVKTTDVPNQYMQQFFPVIYDGNLIIGSTYDYVAYLAVMPLSEIYVNAMTGIPTTNTPATYVGTQYTYSEYEFVTWPIITTIAIPSSGGLSIYVSLMLGAKNYLLYIANLSPSNWSVVSSFTFYLTDVASSICTAPVGSTWNGVFILMFNGPSSSCNTLYVVVADPKSSNYEYTYINMTQNTDIAILGYEGYLVVSQQPLSDSTVTFVVYQILLDHTYVFQNVAVSTTSSTITFSGVLYDETAGAPVANATVWLVAVRSYVKQYSNDVVPLASTTTDSAGHFTVSAPMQSGYNAYGVLYTP